MRTELCFQRKLRRMLVAAAIVGPVALTPEMSAAEGLLDFLFGGGQKQRQQTSSFNDPQSPPPRPVVEARDLPSACAVARQIFSADARRGLTGADVSGLLSGKPDQGFLRLQHRQSLCRNRRTLRR